MPCQTVGLIGEKVATPKGSGLLPATHPVYVLLGGEQRGVRWGVGQWGGRGKRWSGGGGSRGEEGNIEVGGGGGGGGISQMDMISDRMPEWT